MKPLILLSAVASLFAPASLARAEEACRIGDVCTLQDPLFGCRDAELIKNWIDLYVAESREAAERFLSEQAAAGQCARFAAGDRLVPLRYLGMRRLEARRPGESQRYILLLK